MKSESNPVMDSTNRGADIDESELEHNVLVPMEKILTRRDSQNSLASSNTQSFRRDKKQKSNEDYLINNQPISSQTF